MAELTREQIVSMRSYNPNEEGPLSLIGLAKWHAICDLALRAAEAGEPTKAVTVDTEPSAARHALNVKTYPIAAPAAPNERAERTDHDVVGAHLNAAPNNERAAPVSSVLGPDVSHESRASDTRPVTGDDTGQVAAHPAEGLAELAGELERCAVLEREIGTAKGSVPIALKVPLDLIFRIGEVLRSSAGQVPQGMVLVTKPGGFREALDKVGKRLRNFYSNRFALANPVHHTDNERQVLLVALRLLDEALAAAERGAK